MLLTVLKMWSCMSQNTNNAEMQMKQLVYFLENAILNLPEDQEQMVWLIDFKGWSIKKSSPVSVARETAKILQNHYPERLNVAILYNPPRLFEAFWTVGYRRGFYVLL